MTDVTRLLSQIDKGDPNAVDQLLPLVYDKLRQLAAARLINEKPGQTLQATALVHEAAEATVAGRATPVVAPRLTMRPRTLPRADARGYHPLSLRDKEGEANRIRFPRWSISDQPVAEQRWAIAWDASPRYRTRICHQSQRRRANVQVITARNARETAMMAQ
jgi:hypothetical protein